MISVFNEEALRLLFQDFYDITRIRIAIFDAQMHELVAWPEQHMPFCRAIRSSEAGRAACEKSDREACACAMRRKVPYIYRCHAGLTEAIVPLHVGNVLAGYLWCGHAFSYPSIAEGLKAIRECTSGLPITEADVQSACTAHPIVTEAYVRSAARILHATASFLVLERMATIREDSAAAQLDAYLSAHYAKAITVEMACSALNVSRSKLYRLCEQIYGEGFSSHLRRLRLENAKQMLVNSPESTVAEVAEASGFADYNYFIALFSQMYGLSPRAWRKRAIQ